MRRESDLNRVRLIVLSMVILIGIMLGSLVSDAAENTSSSASVRVLEDSSPEHSKAYWDIYGIPASYMTIENNGGAESGRALENAFDYSLGTSWKSSVINNDNTKNFHNMITVTFKGEVEIDRLLYASANEGDGKGYPKELKIFFYEKKENGDYECFEYQKIKSGNTNKMVCVSFGKTVKCERVILEWCDVPRYHYWNATASEIIFTQPEDDYSKIFADNLHLSLNEKYDTLEELEALDDKAKLNVNYETKLKALIERARKIVRGELTINEKRLFAVDNSDGGTIIEQNGDILSYIRNTLDMGWYGSNKQITGISALSGDTITVYVEGKEGDKLPKIIFSQYYGHWSGWQTGEQQLSLGENTFTVPSWDTSKLGHRNERKSGGPIYISNPWTQDEQSSSVKVYIEGGQTFPVFRSGEDADAYKAELKAYLETRNDALTFNMTELQSSYTQMTIYGDNANRIYNQQGKDPQGNLDSWDTYMRELLAFDGVEFDKEGKYYNPKNEKLRLNFRMMQPYGAAFGANQVVGIFTDDWVDPTIYSTGYRGWGIAHEIGHTMDTWQCLVSETTNNMISKFDNSMGSTEPSRGEFVNDLKYLTNDRTFANNRETIENYSYFDTNRMNYLVWWHVESMVPGTWGNMKNLYRYDSVDTSGMTSTEKNIYYMSRASGYDLGAYFERFGYRLSTSDPLFTVETASDKYKTLMKAEIDAGNIKTGYERFWYLDYNEFRYVRGLDNGGVEGDIHLYDSEKKDYAPKIKSVGKTAAGYGIVIEKPEGSAHLGYEIWEGDDVIGFIYDEAFTDTAFYEEGYVPQYKVRAFDRGLNHSKFSDVVSPVESAKGVCRIKETGVTYNYLDEAVSAAESGQTIELIADIKTTGIVITKDLTIRCDVEKENPITISKIGNGAIFDIRSGTVNISGGVNDALIIDGNSFLQSGSVIKVNGGNLNLAGTTIRNNIITSNGGAIDAPSGRVNINGCVFENNSAQNGGAVSIGSKTFFNCTNTVMKNNNASGAGGAIYLTGGGIIESLNGCTIEENSAKNGGGLYVDGKTEPKGAVIKNNTASNNGGGIYYETGVTARQLILTGTEITNNKAGNKGNGIYVNQSSSRVTLNGAVFGDGDNIQSMFIANAQMVSATDSNIPEIGFNETSSVTVEKTSNGIAITEGSLTITINKNKQDITYPSLHNGDLIIPASDVKKSADEGGQIQGHRITKVDAKDATCTVSGNIEYYFCSICNEKYLDEKGETPVENEEELVISPVGHKMKYTAAKDVTCTENGNTAHYYCENCKKYFEDKEGTKEIEWVDILIEAEGHNMTHVEGKEATKSEYGNLEYYHCSECNRNFEDEEGTNEISNVIIRKNIDFINDIDYTKDIKFNSVMAMYLNIDGISVKDFDSSKVRVNIRYNKKTVRNKVPSKLDNGILRVKVADVYPLDMTKNAEVEIVYDGELVNCITYSAASFIIDILNDSTGKYSSKYKALCKAALNYGGNAQLYLSGKKVKNSELANYSINKGNVIKASKPSNKKSIKIVKKKVSKVKTSMTFSPKTSMKVYFTYKGKIKSLKAYNGKRQLTIKKSSKNRYYVQISSIESKNFKKTVTVTVKEKGKTILTVKDSPYAYARTYWNSKTLKTRNFVRALKAYGDAAAAYEK